MQTTNSLVMHRGLIGKADFPRLIVPAAATLAGAVDFRGGRPAASHFHDLLRRPSHRLLLALPVFAILALAAAFAMGLWLSVLNLRYRDIVNMLPLITQLLFFTTPIAYSSSLLWILARTRRPESHGWRGGWFPLVAPGPSGRRPALLSRRFRRSHTGAACRGSGFFQSREPDFPDEFRV